MRELKNFQLGMQLSLREKLFKYDICRILMWVAKIIFYPDESAIFAPLTKKFNVTLMGYPLNFFKKKEKWYYTGAAIMIGEELDKRDFFNMLKKDKRVLKFESNGDYIIGVYEQLPRLKGLYDPELIRVKPVIINNKGEEIWEIASLNKKALIKFIDIANKDYNRDKTKIIKFTKLNATNVSILNLVPELTGKQKQAIELAVKHGYYNCPRKTDLEKLAKFMGISYSTYQVHLRKAEMKLLPFSLKNIEGA